MSFSHKTGSFLILALVPALLWILPITATAKETPVKHFTLPNGFEVLVKEDHARKVATVQLWVMVGGADEARSEWGISHLIEHMAFKGTARRGLGQIAKEVEALGGETNAYTSWDETVFHITVPSDAVFKGLDIVSDAVLRPTLDPKELENEKKVVLEEILEGEERPSKKSWKLLCKNAWTKSPYRIPIIGYKDTVAGFTRDDVVQFRKKWYVPENMFFVVVGDVDAEKVRAEVERLTKDIAPTAFVRPQRVQEPPQQAVRSEIVRDKNSRQTRLNIAFHIPARKDSEVNILDLVSNILGARESSPLIRVIQKEKGLVNSIAAYAYTPKDPGLFVILATLDSKNLEAATKAIGEEIAKLAKEKPSDTELKRAKTDIESQVLYSKESVQGVARLIGSFRADLNDPAYEDKYLKLNAGVTADQITQAVNKYLSSPNLTVTALVPEKDKTDVTGEKLAGILKSSLPQRTEAAATEQNKQVLKRTLPNGIRVVLEQDNSNALVSFRIACLGGKRFENKKDEGVMNFVARMLDKGAGNMTEMQIARKIEDMGGRLNGFSGYDSFGISASFFSRETEEGLKLLATVFTEPTFPEDRVERERELIINMIKTEADRPVPFALRNLNSAMFREHPYGFRKDGTLTTVAAISREDLKDVYQRFAVPSNTVISAVGDIDLEKTMGLIEDLFGKIPARALEAPPVPKETPVRKPREETVEIERAKAHIVVGYPGVSNADPERFPLQVLANTMAGMGGRLFLELRDKESLAYMVTCFLRPGMDPGMFIFYLACDPKKKEQALKSLFREIERIRTAEISKEELERSKENLIGEHKIALQASWTRAEDRALNTLYGLGYDFRTKFEEETAKVSAADVLKAAKKYLDPEKKVLVQILPEDSKEKK